MKPVTEVRCSGLARPMQCAGSLRFTDLPEQESNDAAKEGTAAGEYLTFLLTGQITPGMTQTHASNGVEFNEDILFYAKEVAEEIKAHAAGHEITSEVRIDWPTNSGITIRGQYDAAYYSPHSDTLCIDDLKFGWGLVEVKENWQLLAYAIGICSKMGRVPQRIQMRILQPRPHHENGPYRTWEITGEELWKYKDRIEGRMAAIALGFAELQTGEKCKYCPAAGEHCSAIGHTFFHGVDYTLTEFKQDSLSEKEIAMHLEMLDRVGEIYKIKKDSLNALAVNRIREGKIVPGWSTEQNYGDRKWKSGISPEVIETLTGKKIVKQEMLSPAKAEKLGVPKDLIAQFVDRHFIGQKLKRVDTGAQADKIFGAPQ